MIGHSSYVRGIIAFIWLCAMLTMSASFACGSLCTDFCCEHVPAVILVANNLLVTSVTSSCGNVRLSGSNVVADLSNVSETCHVEILLSDRSHFSFDVPFTNHIDQCCCASCIEGFDAVWDPVDASAPPQFSDAWSLPPNDANSDASDADAPDE